MPVYTVHAPVNNGADLAATDKFTLKYGSSARLLPHIRRMYAVSRSERCIFSGVISRPRDCDS